MRRVPCRKVKHATREYAEKEVIRLMARDATYHTQAFVCDWCGYWHVGRLRGRTP